MKKGFQRKKNETLVYSVEAHGTEPRPLLVRHTTETFFCF